METDENAPPTKDEKPTQAGLLSPFGFLAGVRAMLSPSVKDSPPQGSDSPVSSSGRPVLRDMNLSSSPRPKSSTPGGPQAPADSGGACPPAVDSYSPLSPSDWPERGERTSVASEISFVSAVSTDINSSLPDVIQLASPYKLGGVESDTDTSTAYESAGEADGNISYGDDVLKVSGRDILLNRPIAVSSPFEAEFSETDSGNTESAKSVNAPTNISGHLNNTISLEDSSGNGSDSLSISFLADHLGGLSLSTPQKSNPNKAHVTLDSDCSGDIVIDDSVVASDSEVKESLDSTITLADADEKEVVSEFPTTRNAQEGKELNSTVDISSDSCITEDQVSVPLEPEPEDLNTTTVLCSESDVVVEPADNEESRGVRSNISMISDSSVEWKLLEDLCESSFNVSALNQSELSVTERKYLEGLDKSYVPSADDQSSIRSDSPSDKESCTLNETVVEVTGSPQIVKLNPSPSVEHSSGVGSATSLESITPETVSEEFSEEVPESSEGLDLPREEAKGETLQEVNGSSVQGDDVELPEVPVNSANLNETQTSPENLNKTETLSENLNETQTLPDPQNLSANSPQENSGELDAEITDIESRLEAQHISDVESPGLPENCDTLNETQSLPDPKANSVGTLSSFEDAPLPVKVPRTFEEILAEQLAAEGQSALPQPESVCDPPVKSFDEAPLPVKAQRTFEEILAAELGTEAPTTYPLESEPCSDAHSNEEVSEKSATDEQHGVSEVEIGSSEQVPPSEESAETSGNLQEEEPPSFETHSNSAEEIPIPIKAPRTFEEILAAELAAQSDPENAVPSFSSEEAPIRTKGPRTFEEILAAELAAQSDPEQAVPSFSNSQEKVSPRKLDESLAKIISSDTNTLESECEPEFISDPALGEFEPAVNQLDNLIEKCKQQELDLEQAEPNVQCVGQVPAKLSLNCVNEPQRGISVTSEESPDLANETVVMVDRSITSPIDPFSSKSKVGFSPKAAKVQVPDTSLFCETTPGDNFGLEEFQSGDAFKDPSAFDFLSLHGCTRSARDLRKESLYVKFDPLVGSLVSDTRSDISFTMHPENSSENQNGASALTEDGLQPSETQLSSSEKLVSLSPSKQTPSNAEAAAPATPVRSNLVKNTPVKTPAHVMLNETLESIGSRGTLVKQEDLIKKLQEHQSVLEEQDKAYQERISELEHRLQEMNTQRVDQLKEKDRQLEEKVQSISELRVVMKEYEQTIARIVAEKSQQKAAYEEGQVEIIRERDEAQQHLNNMEMTFADIHKKYERLKSVVDAFKKNEESLNAALAEKNASIDKIQNMYDMLKSHAVQKLEKANQDLEGMKQKHQQENAKLRAMIKKLEIKTKSLEEALEQKVKENQALTAICDELINKVGD